MSENQILAALKNAFERIIPTQDGRTVITPLEFIVNLIFCYLGDSQVFSLEAIRRFMKATLGKDSSRSAFWERLAGKRLQNYLKQLVAELMLTFINTSIRGSQLLQQLGVTAILLHDSSSIKLLSRAQDDFPGSRTDAGVKVHTTFDLMTGLLSWFQFTPSATHDRNCFPPLELLKGKLIIFDLEYWDYGLLYLIDQAQGFFLSRLKSNAVVYIAEVVQGLSKKCVGASLLSLDWSRKKGDIIEVIIHKLYEDHILRYRVIGFWNPVNKEYHWYITNLVIAAYLIYPLYCLRWQIELLFKACKNSLNANQITSADAMIIQNLLLAALAAHLSTYTILHIGILNLDDDKQWAFSFQRVAKVAVLLARDFILFILNAARQYFDALLNKIKLFANELYDPNYKKRDTSLMFIKRILLEGKT